MRHAGHLILQSLGILLLTLAALTFFLPPQLYPISLEQLRYTFGHSIVGGFALFGMGAALFLAGQTQQHRSRRKLKRRA